MASPFPQTIIVAAYIYFVTSLGPRLMENRKPFDLKRPMIIYNFSIVMFSVYMIYEVREHVSLWVSCVFVFLFFKFFSLYCVFIRICLPFTVSHVWMGERLHLWVWPRGLFQFSSGSPGMWMEHILLIVHLLPMTRATIWHFLIHLVSLCF